MKLKNLMIILAAAVLVFSLAGCTVEIRNPNDLPEEEPFETKEPEEIPKQESSDIQEEQDIPEETPKEQNPLEGVDIYEYASFEEITALGYYPLWMQPYSVIIYDENGTPEITEGGAITEEDAAKEEYSHIWYFDPTIEETCRIKPNTKVEYFRDGFIQNIYFLWPDGSYNLSPFEGWDDVG
ncbi:MAG: hypothetical protein IKJ82_01370 [Oscillospiraceae bacterium]|nr:hypothetical protein [Oscillospiraceae bacterium]